MQTPPAADVIPGFDALGLSPAIAKAVIALGYEEPTPIQREAIPLLLDGQDLLGQAGTGTGKTAAFALPMIDRIAAASKARNRGARGLVLVPTRELAMQVSEALHKYAKGHNLHVVPLYGGAPMDVQVRALRRGAELVVATPGRALDHLRRQTLDLSELLVLVLDEADEMLDMGFADDLETIIAATPEMRQTALFAATMAPRLAAIAARHLRTPKRITIPREKRAAGKMPRIRQVVHLMPRAQKTTALGRVLDFESPKSAIVFCRTRLEVDALTDTLTAHGYGAKALHGGMEQKQRDRIMQLFRGEQVEILVATDVAARGLDIEHVSHVINYDVPSAPEVYVHRIGRTGRAGRDGVAITLADPREHRFLRMIESAIKQKIDVRPLPSEADLEARRLEVTRDALRAQLDRGGLEGARQIVDALAPEFDVLDIAAAAIRLIHEAAETTPVGPMPAASEYESPRGAAARSSRARAPKARPTSDGGTRGASADGRVVLRLSVGSGAGVRPADIVGAITNEAGVESRELRGIRIAEAHSTVEVPEALVPDIVAALRATTIRGRKVHARPYADGPRSRSNP
jgi:ATP-dependent RNA helicase DeaD